MRRICKAVYIVEEEEGADENNKIKRKGNGAIKIRLLSANVNRRKCVYILLYTKRVLSSILPTYICVYCRVHLRALRANDKSARRRWLL